MLDPAKVSAALERLRLADPELSAEISKRRSRAVTVTPEALGGTTETAPRLLTRETIVLRSGRPVLAISQDKAQLIFKPDDSRIWSARLTAAQRLITPAIRAVGRVEVSAHPAFTWIGTAWLVAPGIVATNRHVAREFARASGAEFIFRAGTRGRTMQASVDFLEEIGRGEERVAKVREVLHIEDEDGPDVAFLRLAGAGPAAAAPIPLSAGRAPQPGQKVAVIGYPARDSRIPDQDLMDQLFGDVYDKKRLAPGQIQAVAGSQLEHDCTTLGGNSGSVVLDLATGQAVGIHFAGRFLEANLAVPSALIAERLHAVGRGEARRAPVTVTAAPLITIGSNSGATSFTCTIPLQITIEVGAPQSAPPIPVAGAVAVAPVPMSASISDDDDFGAEAVASDYLDRKGYQAKFLGAANEVPLPKITKAADQILTFDFAGNKKEQVLKYEHFSVVMRRDRRLCYFSAVNINGAESRKEKRTGWLRDPRIPATAQIRDECYGNAPKFSRGHMTRREDPVWGVKTAAARGNSDSMHVTNAVPQMQTFNAGIWLGLEDYALDHTRDDDMKVCVLTGPVFASNDPVQFDIRIPRVFWKVIAFIHDKTGKLSATGYSISQEKFLSETEFVFGAYETHQRSLKWIEERAGLSFGRLTKLDRFEDAEEALPRPLQDFRQIRFA